MLPIGAVRMESTMIKNALKPSTIVYCIILFFVAGCNSETSVVAATPPEDDTQLEERLAALEAIVAAQESTIAAQDSKIATLESTVTAQESEITTLQSVVATQESDITSLQSDLSTLEADNTALEAIVNDQAAILAYFSIEDLSDPSTGKNYPTVRITAANLQVVNGLNDTATANGTGNLIVGYNQLAGFSRCSDGSEGTQAGCEGAGFIWSDQHRSGSHNIVTGEANNYSSYGGLVAGYYSTINALYSSVSGGRLNIASGAWSSVSGGRFNIASGEQSSVSGGQTRIAPGSYNWAAGSLLESQ